MKKQLLLVGLFLLVLTLKTSAQNDDDRKLIIQQTNVEELKKIAKESKERYDYFFAKAEENGTLKLTIKNKQGQTGYLNSFDRNGTPLYYFNDNVNAAITARIDKIWQGGSSGLDLDGTGIRIGHWEISAPLATHQELDGKINFTESPTPGSHATHTAATMVGGAVNASARGMAPNATVDSFTANSDLTEMADFAFLGGILTNHSYRTGDPNGNVPIYGAYTDLSADWDNVTYNAPFLTVCKSASNNRNDGVNIDDNGYDTVYTIATAKNIIVVGAIDDIAVYSGPSSVVQSSFSNWGPTDDWRIKPDITTNGVSLFSADNASDTSYGIKSGTSMSTPTVAGAVALLQQHYHNINSVYMKSATVRALLFNTTDESGDHDGPDFQSGWGVLNAERAANVISNNGTTSKIEELTLSNNETYITPITVDGTGNLELVIAWTDPKGTPVSGTDNATSMLINDLDVRLSGNSETYTPWIMVPNSSFNNFTDGARKGDNFRDNVERIDIKNIPAGNYIVSVSHKGTLLNGSQDFSLVVNGVTDSALGVNNYALNSLLKVYPNPSTLGTFQIELLQSKNLGEKTAIIYDLQGRLILEKSFDNDKTEINTSHLSSGNYLLVLKSEKGVYKKLIIVE